ncbi:uncharacterized protein BCR38DRAFT_148244 [Pseudomassariella vexata]|uniref:F-box domain-containing protein n=1 Tax=Pseudomassariella vexata TaxID=1141098 RepID=A0A1Y2D5U6_9PEZI|nr:uncharacterized protein BCR38DRAFT_148244 [Pseudomassariella vexata]ORY54577.1 hypothetical protein BCR38DRAFT_148244 [Pseudomassariella vexata]
MLGTLPNELIAQIVNYLDHKPDLCALHSASRRLHAVSWPAFGACCFSTVRTDLSKDSMIKLEGIANHQQLRHFVRDLHILWVFRDQPLGRGNFWPRDNAGRVQFDSPSVIALNDLLVNKLINCRSFHVENYVGAIHTTDIQHPEWGLSNLSPSDAVAVLFSIIARAQLPVEAFRINLKENLASYRLPPSGPQEESFRNAWASHLQQLHLSWLLRRDDAFQRALDLVTTATCLKKLCLQWPELSSSMTTAPSGLLQGFLAAENLPRLTHFKLMAPQDMSRITISELLFRLKDSLVFLHFVHVGLRSGTWKEILSDLHGNFPRLEYLTIHNCLEGLQRKGVFFCPFLEHPVMPALGGFELVQLRYGEWEGVSGVRYVGKDMDSALDLMGISIYGTGGHPIGRRAANGVMHPRVKTRFELSDEDLF